MKFRVAVIGLGRMGHTRINCIKKDPRCELVAVCDVDCNKLKEFDCATFNDPYELFQKTKIDIVFLCTFNWMLPELAIKALSLGVYVFTEKPPGKNSQDVQRILDEELKHNNLFVYYGFNHRHHNSIMKAKSLIEQGIIGDILWFRGVYGKCGSLLFEQEWRNQLNKSGGGILLDQGIHMIDLIYYFGFKPDYLEATVQTQYWNMQAEDSCVLMMRSGKKTAIVHSLATQWKHKFSLEIGGTEGLIELNGLLTSTNSYGPETCSWCTRNSIYQAETMGNPQLNEIRYIKDNSWEIEHNEFINGIENNLNLNSFYTKQAYDVMNIISNIYHKSN